MSIVVPMPKRRGSQGAKWNWSGTIKLYKDKLKIRCETFRHLYNKKQLVENWKAETNNFKNGNYTISIIFDEN